MTRDLVPVNADHHQLSDWLDTASVALLTESTSLDRPATVGPQGIDRRCGDRNTDGETGFVAASDPPCKWSTVVTTHVRAQPRGSLYLHFSKVVNPGWYRLHGS